MLFRSINISLRTRLLFGLGVMIIPIIVLGANTIFFLHRAAISDTEIVQKQVELHPVLSLQVLISQAVMSANDYLINGKTQERENFRSQVQDVKTAFNTALAELGDTRERELVLDSQNEWRKVEQLAESILRYSHPVGNMRLAAEMERMDNHMNHSVALLGQVHDLAIQEIKDISENVKITSEITFAMIVALFVIGTIIAVVTAVLLARSILVPLSALEKAESNLGSGNLSYRINLIASDELGRVAQGFNAMAAKIEIQQEELKKLSFRDELTGVYNRRHFQQAINEEILRSKRYDHPCALLMLDLDYFKVINDTYGHQTGDEVLKSVSKIISHTVRPTDVVARYGGEEFSVILPETNHLNALILAERIRNEVASLIISLPNVRTITVTISVGIAAFPQNAQSDHELIAAADKALYQAKDAGRNRVFAAD